MNESDTPPAGRHAPFGHEAYAPGACFVRSESKGTTGMGIFKRIQDIVNANLNDLVDEIEDPSIMLTQAVAEMEEAIVESKREVAKAMANEKLTERELESNKNQVREWQTRAEKAVQANDDSLARMALGRRQEYSGVVAALEEQREAAAETSQLLRQQLDAMLSQLGEAKRKLGTLTARMKAAEVRSKIHSAGQVELDQAAFQKFEKMRSKVERVEAEAEAMRELDRGAAPASSSSSRRERENDLDSELEALKRKLGQ